MDIPRWESFPYLRMKDDCELGDRAMWEARRTSEGGLYQALLMALLLAEVAAAKGMTIYLEKGDALLQRGCGGAENLQVHSEMKVESKWGFPEAELGPLIYTLFRFRNILVAV
jgi:hypothetical protein